MKQLIVIGFPAQYRRSDVERMFSRFGRFEKLVMIRNQDGTSRRFCFLTFLDDNAAAAAIAALHNTTVDDCLVRVEYARPKPQRAASGASLEK